MGASDPINAQPGSASIRLLGAATVSRERHVEVESEGRVLRVVRSRIWLRPDTRGIGIDARFGGAVSSEPGWARRFSEARGRAELLSSGNDGVGRVQRRAHSGSDRFGVQWRLWPLRCSGLERLFGEFDDGSAVANVLVRVAPVQGTGVAGHATRKRRIVGSESGPAGSTAVQDRPGDF